MVVLKNMHERKLCAVAADDPALINLSISIYRNIHIKFCVSSRSTSSRSIASWSQFCYRNYDAVTTFFSSSSSTAYGAKKTDTFPSTTTTICACASDIRGNGCRRTCVAVTLFFAHLGGTRRRIRLPSAEISIRTCLEQNVC
jgi:hypothetical protein